MQAVFASVKDAVFFGAVNDFFHAISDFFDHFIGKALDRGNEGLPADTLAGIDNVQYCGEGMEPFGRKIGQWVGRVAELDSLTEDAGGIGIGRVGGFRCGEIIHLRPLY